METLYNFVNGPTSPSAALIQGSDGNLYGTSRTGGAGDYGAVFRIDAAGGFSTVASLGYNGNRGSNPYAALIQANDGNFYGTTYAGGVSGYGTVFRLGPTGALTTLVEFGGSIRGSGVAAGLVRDADGNVLGTTFLGGATGNGTVFRVTPAGVLTTLVEFTGTGGAIRGSGPYGTLILGNDQNFYGTTTGGALGNGTIFRMTAAGVLTTLVEFTGTGGANRGAIPYAALIEGSDGNFYGTTSRGGSANKGTIFRMTTAGVLTTLVEFTGTSGANRGSTPFAPLILGSDQNFYGTTRDGGANNNGTTFRMTPEGVLSTVVEFTGSGASNRGSYPESALVQGADGSFYGTTRGGVLAGNIRYGTAFRISPAGVLTTLVEFSPDGDASNEGRGRNPAAALVLGGDGNFYGSTQVGGAADCGTIFRVTPAGTLTSLLEFTGNGASNRGARPSGALIQASDGDFYGTTYQGGASNYGTVFRMTSGGALTTLVEFTGGGTSNRGSRPTAALLQAADGNLYGTTFDGGTNDYGTIFRMTPAGALTTLIDFGGFTIPGVYPAAALVLDGNGNFYGTTSNGGNGWGTVFRMTSAGALTTLVRFTNGDFPAPGASSQAGLLRGSNGNLYGTTFSGGTNFSGTVFLVGQDGSFAPLVSFTGNGASARGRYPYSTLVMRSDGNYYGTTSAGGLSGYGTIFRMTAAGALTTLVDFTAYGASGRGANARAGLVPGSDGNLYGTTSGGGSGGAGTVYRLRFGPSPVTSSASAITGISATLNGTVNPNGTASMAFFEYGTSPNALVSTTAVQNLPAGTSPTSVGATISGLTAGTTYYFRLRADNSEQSQPQRGEILRFTPGSVPSLISVAREGVTARVRWQDLSAGAAYAVQFSDDLLGSWQTAAGTVSSNQNGVIEFIDPSAPPQRFYRLLTSP